MVFLDEPHPGGARARPQHEGGGRARHRLIGGWSSLLCVSPGTVFAAAFILSAYRIPKEFGLLLAVAILTDALVVRMTLVPAFLTLLHEKSWYIPRWLDRLLPNITIEPPHDREVLGAPVAEPAAEGCGTGSSGSRLPRVRPSAAPVRCYTPPSCGHPTAFFLT